MYRSHLQHSIHSDCTVFTEDMHNSVYTIQCVQISCTTQYRLYSMYRSHAKQYIRTVQQLHITCTTQYRQYSRYKSLVQHSTNSTECTNRICMYNTAYTVQISWTAQYTLYSVYRSHVQHSIH